MWYAVEFAGNRADIYEFTRRELRDAWVRDEAARARYHANRAALTARDPLVRRTPWRMRIDGDPQAWRVLAEQRVARSPNLARHRAIIYDYDWPESDHHRWVATAPEREIVSWAEAIKAEADE
jgi:hypothetical protein